MDLLNEITFNNTYFHLVGEMEIWCDDNIGKGGWLYSFDRQDSDVWGVKSMFGNTTFMFKEEKDYNWFVLRWSS
jgi:hypothetical protein